MDNIKSILRKLIKVVIILLCLIYLNNNNDITTKQQKRIDDSSIQNVLSEIKYNDFQIHFIDVGQADCILIKDGSSYALVDAGNNEDGPKIVKYLNELGITNIQYVFATHPHEDHIGGMDIIIKSFTINHYYMIDIMLNNMTFTEITKSLEKKNMTYEIPEIGEVFKLENATIEVLWLDNDREDINKDSMILKVTYKNTSYMLTGDATTDSEKQILEKDLKSNVLKVGHHGSKYSSSAQFLTKVHPEYAIISVGKENDYGFPKKVILDKLEYLNCKIYRTDLNGTIIVSSNGEDIDIVTKRTDTNEEKVKQ